MRSSPDPLPYYRSPDKSRQRRQVSPFSGYYGKLTALLLLGLLLTVLLFTSLYLLAPTPHDSREDQILEAAPTNAFCSRSRPPLVCAHGGDSTNVPPNTMDSFKAALRAGADCVEVDSAMSKDGHLVVLHVRELQQLMGPGWTPGLQVGDLSLQHLKALRWPTGQEVVTVKDAIQLVSPHVECVTLDVKTYQNEAGEPVDEQAISEALLKLVHDQSCDNCMIWAKSDNVVKILKRLSPGQRVGYIVMNETAAAIEAHMHEPLRMAEPEVTGVHFAMVDDYHVKLLHSANKQLFAWTINNPELLQHILDVGVDAVVTNYPTRALQAIENRLMQCGEVLHARHQQPPSYDLL